MFKDSTISTSKSDTTKSSTTKSDTKKETKTSKYKKITVRSGDTLYGIASKYNTTIKELIKLNHIKNENYIYVGEVIKVPR